MKVTQTTGISIGVLAVAIPLVASAVVWYDGRQDEEHNAIVAQHVAGDVELSLQQIELELKLYRTIKERRELTPDEEDRKAYLESLREVLLAEQRKKVT